jgi:hypothetical protein
MNRKQILLILFCVLVSAIKVFATHAAGAELTYKFISRNISGDTYEITGTFYRDCAGVTAPNTLPISIASTTCNYTTSTFTLPQISVTGQEINFPCSTAQTKCTNPNSAFQGFQKYVYRGNVLFPFQCTDWRISYSVLARNCAITTIMQGFPCGQTTPLYVESTLNNLDFTSNNSPSFSNDPIVTICLNQNFSFNNGVLEQDGDSLSFELVDALQGHNVVVPYIPPYSGINPLTSLPAASINNITGDITINAQAIEVSVLAIRINEFRNGSLIGSVIRDMQFNVDNCIGNVLPVASGINGSLNYTAHACAGSTLSFFINSDDTNATQNITMTWDTAIAGATFTINGAPHPTGTFSWTPTLQDIRNQPYIFTVTLRDDNCPANAFQTYSFLIYVTEISVQGIVTPSTFSMSDGAIDLSVIRGAPPFVYLWSPTGDTTEDLNNIPQGNYSVIVTDSNGCTENQSFYVPVSCAGFSVQFQSPLQPNGFNISCHGEADGSITAIVSGGNPVYSYDWGNGSGPDSTIDNLLAGTYLVTISDQYGCTLQNFLTLTEPPAIIHAGNTSMNICEGADTTLSEPTGNFYLWSTGDTTNLSQAITIEGTYTVQVTDSFQCTVSDTFFVLYYPAIDTSINGTPSFCEGDSVVLNAVPGYIYHWSSNETTQSIYVSDSGTISVVLSDNHGCSDTASVNVTEFLPPASPHIIPATDSLIVINPAAGTYLWFLDGNSTGTTGSFYLYPVDGLYYCILTDSNGCTSISDTILITAINRKSDSRNFSVYPNPTKSLLTISSSKNNPIENIRVFNFLGVELFPEQHVVSVIDRVIDFSDYTEGFYFIRISNRSGSEIKKVTIDR